MLADQLTLYQSGGSDYDHHIATRPTGFSELPTALQLRILQIFGGQIQCYVPFKVKQSTVSQKTKTILRHQKTS
jgi:hypothetical protein